MGTVSEYQESIDNPQHPALERVYAIDRGVVAEAALRRLRQARRDEIDALAS